MLCKSFLLHAAATALFGAVANDETPALQPTSVIASQSQASSPQGFRRTCGNRIVTKEPSIAGVEPNTGHNQVAAATASRFGVSAVGASLRS
jgi:hypothetical protein